jgi:hypothetical protein
MQSTAGLRELAYRVNHGVEVSLLWHPEKDRLTVMVVDVRTRSWFNVPATADNALDVFNHPFAYAARDGVEYELALPSQAA